MAAVVRAIPKGQVLAYGSVALRANRPGAARAVVQALRRVRGLPWWRVVRADFTLAPLVAREQAAHLRREGVRVVGRRVVDGPALREELDPKRPGRQRSSVAKRSR